jgi:hypothetical protein
VPVSVSRQAPVVRPGVQYCQELSMITIVVVPVAAAGSTSSAHAQRRHDRILLTLLTSILRGARGLRRWIDMTDLLPWWVCFLPLVRSLVTLATMIGMGLFHRRAKGRWPTINEWSTLTGSLPGKASVLHQALELMHRRAATRIPDSERTTLHDCRSLAGASGRTRAVRWIVLRRLVPRWPGADPGDPRWGDERCADPQLDPGSPG